MQSLVRSFAGRCGLARPLPELDLGQRYSGSGIELGPLVYSGRHSL